MFPGYDPLDEKHRWCVYCKADCWPDREYQEHADDCPTVTGAFPMKPEEFPHGLRCGRCHSEIGPGGTYRHIRIEGTDDEFPGYEVVCDDCAIGALIAGERAS